MQTRREGGEAMSKLTDKQQRFCEEYLIDLNATQAAIRAGYSEKTANRIASENLTKLDIQEYIAEKREELSNSTKITTEKVLKAIADIALEDRSTVFETMNKISSADIDTEERMEILNGVQKLLVKDADKLKALDMLSKHLGLYEKDNAQGSQNIVTKIEVEYV